MDLLTDWRALTSALEEDAVGADALSAAAATNLLQLLAASVHKACGGTLVAGRQDARCWKHVVLMAPALFVPCCQQQGVRRQPRRRLPGRQVQRTSAACLLPTLCCPGHKMCSCRWPAGWPVRPPTFCDSPLHLLTKLSSWQQLQPQLRHQLQTEQNSKQAGPPTCMQ